MLVTALSDFNNQTISLPDGDLLVYCGNLSKSGSEEEVLSFLQFLSSLKQYKHIVLTPGHLDVWIEKNVDLFRKKCKEFHIIPLINEKIEIEGKVIWGSPLCPTSSPGAFNLNLQNRRLQWANIPRRVDILLTHCPPYGVLDLEDTKRLGCVALRDRVREHNPTYHVFGLANKEPGITTKNDSMTVFINASAKVFQFEI